MQMKLAMLGFGNVGQGLAKILVEQKEHLKNKYNFEYKVVGIYDLHLGGVVVPDGEIDLKKLLGIMADGGKIADYPGAADLTAEEVIKESGADALLEMTYTDLKTGQPAINHCRWALERHMHVSTSNKGPAALAMKELTALAAEHGVQFKFEGSVMSGTPVINLACNNLAGATISSFKGILNGTTNFILTRMEDGLTYEAALKEAQEKGYAEADPTADVEGFDAGAKGVILANLLMDAGIGMDDIAKKGISHLTPDDIKKAAEEKHRYKVLVEAKKVGDKVDVKVGPVKLPLTDPLTGVSGATNAVTFVNNMLGPVTIIGAGAGRVETGFSLLADLLEINRSYK